MTDVTAHLFCDPFAVAGWHHQPDLRHVEYAFPEVTWRLRPIVAHPTPLEGEDATAFAEAAADAGRGAGLPVEEGRLANGVPASWAACEALVRVQADAPDRALSVLRRLRAETFARGRPPASARTLGALADRVGNVEPGRIEEAVGSRRATAAVGRNLERGRSLVESLPDGEVRGDPKTMPLAERLIWDGAATGEPAGDGDRDGGSGRADDDAPRTESSVDRVPAPPLVEFRSGERTVVVDPAQGFDEFADVLRGFDADLGELDWDAAIHGREAMQAYGLEKRTAENLSNEQFAPKVRDVLSRLDDAFVAEIAACADLDPDTTRVAVRELSVDGLAERTPTGAWRLVPEGVH